MKSRLSFDTVALSVMAVLAVVIGAVILLGEGAGCASAPMCRWMELWDRFKK